jgi:hypothetical protein
MGYSTRPNEGQIVTPFSISNPEDRVLFSERTIDVPCERAEVIGIVLSGHHKIVQLEAQWPALVSCPLNKRYVVAIKMGRRQGVRREHI